MIPPFVQTLRFKLAFINTAVFTALIIGSSVVFLNLQRAGLIATIDERLVDRADTVIKDFIAARDEGLGISGPGRPWIDPARFSNFFIQFWDDTGTDIIFRSRSLQVTVPQPEPDASTRPATGQPAEDASNEREESAPTASAPSVAEDPAQPGVGPVQPATTQPSTMRIYVEMPLTGAAAAVHGRRDRNIETIRTQEIKSLIPDGHGLRVLTLYVDPKNRPELSLNQRRSVPFFLQVALSLSSVENSMSALKQNLMIVIPAAVLAAGLASWLMAWRSLSPIGRIAREARELTALRLDRRIRVPQGRDEVVEMTSTINEMLDRLEAAFRAQERFIADAAHELKTPVATALSGTQVLLQKARSMEEYEEFVASLQDELRRIGQMVDSLLTLARADAGLSPGTASPVAVNEIVMTAVELCQPIAVQREVRLVPKLAMPGANSPELIVVGDDDLLYSMVANLIRNAIRYAPVESPIEVEVSALGSEAQIAVRDSGPGIDPAYLSRIFDRFFQVPSDQHRLKGSGLGLAIARGVARLHGGDISVVNRPAGGCEFIIRLPIKTA